MNCLIKFLVVMITMIVTASCGNHSKKGMNIQKETFGKINEKVVDLYTLTNTNQVEMKITNYGGIVTSFKIPDKNGILEDVVLGYDNLEGYLKANPYFGAIIGRYGNRIGNATFTLDGKKFSLAKNDGANNLHGGVKGFDKVVWEAETITGRASVSLKLYYLSKDNEGGFPGNLNVNVIYTLTNDNTFRIDYTAITDRPTIVNLTHHTYWNFAGNGSGEILNHKLMVHADTFTPIDKSLITTGDISSVKGTPMDFRTPKTIGDEIDDDYEQLKFAGGYDHNWVLNKTDDGIITLAATVYDPMSGRFMEIHTTEPGIQFYSGNLLDGSIVGKKDNIYEFRNGFCLETQHYPDSPNKPDFPSVVLRPGETYSSTTIHKFSTK